MRDSYIVGLRDCGLTVRVANVKNTRFGTYYSEGTRMLLAVNKDTRLEVKRIGDSLSSPLPHRENNSIIARVIGYPDPKYPHTDLVVYISLDMLDRMITHQCLAEERERFNGDKTYVVSHPKFREWCGVPFKVVSYNGKTRTTVDICFDHEDKQSIWLHDVDYWDVHEYNQLSRYIGMCVVHRKVAKQWTDKDLSYIVSVDKDMQVKVSGRRRKVAYVEDYMYFVNDDSDELRPLAQLPEL